MGSQGHLTWDDDHFLPTSDSGASIFANHGEDGFSTHKMIRGFHTRPFGVNGQPVFIYISLSPGKEPAISLEVSSVHCVSDIYIPFWQRWAAFACDLTA